MPCKAWDLDFYSEPPSALPLEKTVGTTNKIFCLSRGDLATVLGVTSALIGLPIGAIIGHRDDYLIEHKAATGTN